MFPLDNIVEIALSKIISLDYIKNLILSLKSTININAQMSTNKIDYALL